MTKYFPHDCVTGEPGCFHTTKSITWISRRHLRPDGSPYTLSVPPDFYCDGASGKLLGIPVPEIGHGWIYHDWAYAWGKWDDGTRITRLQADEILSDVMKGEGHWFRARSWYAAVRAGAKAAWGDHRRREILRNNESLFRMIEGGIIPSRKVGPCPPRPAQ